MSRPASCGDVTALPESSNAGAAGPLASCQRHTVHAVNIFARLEPFRLRHRRSRDPPDGCRSRSIKSFFKSHLKLLPDTWRHRQMASLPESEEPGCAFTGMRRRLERQDEQSSRQENNDAIVSSSSSFSSSSWRPRTSCFPTNPLCSCVLTSSMDSGIEREAQPTGRDVSVNLFAGPLTGRLYHLDTRYQPITVHTQVEFTHYLVPDLYEITQACYYWGSMDRFEAEALLENKPEGTFLLRDSAQSDYLFSVSFRRYCRTLHARVEQLDHLFSFDSYDPNVFRSSTITALIDHYKDPARCLFFEPQLSQPLKRTFVFSLQHLCRAAICKRIKYDEVQQFPLCRSLKAYLREYHYKRPVCVRQLQQ